MSIYWDILDGVLAELAALGSFADFESGGEGRRYRLGVFKAPAWSPALHAWPQVVVAPREDLAEQHVGEHLAGNDIHGYDVYVGVALPADNDERTLRERLDRREDVRRAVYRAELLQDRVPGQWNVHYDPAPPVPRTWPEAVEMTWQRFTFLVESTEPR